MADAVVSAIVETIVGNLSSAAVKEIGLLWGLEDELNSLQSTFTTLQLVLQDAEIKQRNNLLMQNWLKKLKNAAYDAENILDEMTTERLRREADTERGMSCFCLSNHLAFRFKMAHKVKNSKKKLSVIAKERDQFHLSEGVKESRFGVTLESRETNSTVNESEIFGREQEKEMIIEKLLDSMLDQSDLSIHAIWGMGGLGKTTLAQMIYNNEKIERHFELRIWVCVSDDFNIKRLVRSLIEFIDKVECNVSNLETLQSQLRERLGGKRFLLVLDDVWNENHTLWDQLKQILKCGLKGSVLVVTTRNEKIASMMYTLDIHHIGHLNDEDSWFLFEQRASSTRKVEENLVAIGKAIVEKCGGVPLAIKALGSLMQFKYDESEWLAIEKSEIWQLFDDENGIFPALRLSYDNLLPHMRQCFAYCCLFPKDYEMEEEELIQLWMANGFVSSNNHRDMFLNGCLIFKELTWRSFFQDIKTNDLGQKTCKMHDLMHDLATSVMRHETYILQNREVQEIPKTVRHLSYLEPFESITKRKGEVKLQIDTSLRSFVILEEDDYSDNVCYSILSNQQYIRALKISDTWFKNLPNLVCKLKHLKYLYMSCSGIESLPESLTRLCNLQTLKLVKSYQLKKLPKNLKVMKNLWFLELEAFHSLLCTPPGLGELSYLIRLSIFIVGEGADEKIDQLKELKLSGSLSIKGLNNVRNLEEAKSANLMGKKNLTSLSLCWGDNLTNESPEHCEEILQGLEPHQDLQRISISYYQGTKFSDWVLNLAFKSISLRRCPRCECLPPMGKLPCLKSVHLSRMDSVKRLGAEWHGDAECSFPALTHLEIENMPNLEEWSVPADSIESFSSLTNLEIWECPKLDRIPFLPALRILFTRNCNAALVSSITCLTTLEELIIWRTNIRALPDTMGNLSSLKTLSVKNCPNLEFLCEGLTCLNSLQRLYIKECEALTSVLTPDNSLPSLQVLVILGCRSLEFLPSFLKPDNSLPSLKTLEIGGCPSLQFLPKGLECLMSLEISECPQLEKRCERPHGEEWPKISHIPDIEINWRYIKKGGESPST